MNNNVLSVILIVSVLSENVMLQSVFPIVSTEKPIPEDGRLNFTGLSIKYGHPAEEHFVITEDGYILTVFHIPRAGCPVFLQHGIIDSASTFIIRGYNSLAIVLAEAGYDVWLGNTRGTRYSRRHTILNPDKDKAFWDFSIHEVATYDIRAMIDYVLMKTNSQKVAAIGHSEGNSVFYMLGSVIPEYNDKISVLIALAPICYLHHVKPPLNVLVKLSGALNDLFKTVGREELLGDQSAIKAVLKVICSGIPFSYESCMEQVILFFAGFDPSELDEKFLEVLIWHYPVGTSRKKAHHWAQIAQAKRFQQYDYGTDKNIQVYGSSEPPEYALNKVTMNVELFVGKNDKVSTIEDVNLLREQLPNANYWLLNHPNMNHLDFVWGLHMNEYLYPPLFQVLQKYCYVNQI